MNEYKLKFIKEYFFELNNCPGWENIANKLIEDGECIVAGDGQIWFGGVGNFIKKSSAENAVGCTKLTFQKDVFLNSVWFKEIRKNYLSQLFDKQNKLTREVEGIINE